VCSGGRYDGLVEQLGGDGTPAVGWALGQERLVALLRKQHGEAEPLAPDVYFVISGERAEAEGLALAERIRDAVPTVRIESHCGGGSFKSQLRGADKSGAHLALILGEAETERRVVGLKSLRVEAPQVELAWERVADEIAARLVR
jgi:histidyl-tRNA synthetase